MTDQPMADNAATGPTGRGRRLRRVRAGLVVGVLCGLVGFALVAQVRATQTGSTLTTAREGDLVRILDDLSAREQRLRTEIANLQRARDRIATSGDSAAAALAEARKRAAELGVLAGTLPARGPGVVVTMREGGARLPAEVLLDALEELRGAGAEAIQIGGAGGSPVRVAASTYFLDSGSGVSVEGTQLAAPYVFTAIGDANTLSAALSIPGGVVDTVRRAGGQTTIAPSPSVAVDALRGVSPPQYARPAS